MKLIKPAAKVLQYTATFVAYGMAGFVYEQYFRDGHFGPKTVFLPIYAFGALVLALLNDLIQFKNPVANLLLKVLVAAIILPLFECICGGISRLVHNGEQTWHYKRFATCGGYVSLESAAAWTVMALAFFLLDPMQYLYRLSCQK